LGRHKGKEEQDNFRKLGWSQDKRPDLSKVVIGLAVIRDGNRYAARCGQVIPPTCRYPRGYGHYIAGENLRSKKGTVKQVLATKGRCHKVRDNLEVKENIYF